MAFLSRLARAPLISPAAHGAALSTIAAHARMRAADMIAAGMTKARRVVRRGDQRQTARQTARRSAQSASNRVDWICTPISGGGPCCTGVIESQLHRDLTPCDVAGAGWYEGAGGGPSLSESASGGPWAPEAATTASLFDTYTRKRVVRYGAESVWVIHRLAATGALASASSRRDRGGHQGRSTTRMGRLGRHRPASGARQGTSKVHASYAS